eukprot:scaffold11371_cov112-Isochrysis_galbana.AAC.9
MAPSWPSYHWRMAGRSLLARASCSPRTSSVVSTPVQASERGDRRTKSSRQTASACSRWGRARKEAA